MTWEGPEIMNDSKAKSYFTKPCRQRLVPPDVTSSQHPGCLERVELNAAVALKTELESMQGLGFNSQKAIQENLRTSGRTKNLINTRVTEVVNVSRSQLLYTSLVGIEAEEDQLFSQALQERLLLAPPPRCHGKKTTDGPSCLLFINSGLVRQKPLPPEEEPINVKPHPPSYHTQSTFDLYKRL